MTPARLPARPPAWFGLFFAGLGGALFAFILAALSPGSFGLGWLASFALALPAVWALFFAWRWGGADRALAWMVALAFVLRLGVGVGLSLALPVWGSPEQPVQQAGYLFKDSYSRDQQAWELARSGRPIGDSFREDFAADQYGGLLALSALVYRIFSPDAHRPFLILVLGAFVTALGVPFLRQGLRRHWSMRTATLAAWIYVFYPDGIFFGSSQLREPFLIGLLCVAFWAVLTWDTRRWQSWLGLVGSLLVMLLLSSRVAAAYAGFLALLFLLEYIVSQPKKRMQRLGWAGLVLGMGVILLLSWGWFRSSARWDLLVTRRGSGQIANIIWQLGEEFTLPVITVYGLTQPVLPAALAETSAPFWKTIVSLRAVGWYALAPFLIYGMLNLWRASDAAQRRRAIWLIFSVVVWLLIASIRGGGDVTDNPRYRSLFLPWLALLAAWAVDWAWAHRDVWLGRWIAVEGIFLAFFTHWYVGRYYRLWLKIPFWQMVIWIIVCSALVLAGGWGWDRWRARHASLPARGK